MATTKDTIISQVPGHVLENYPRFSEFLEAYYEWLHQEGNPYSAIKYHMDYLDFQESLDAYVEQMKNEYLHNVPDSLLLDKELFIKWSKKFNLARGSHASYKFLFKLLFDEQDTEMYLPKENILKTSDGVWVSGESKIIVTATCSTDAFRFQIIEQEREISPGKFEYARATVQTAKFRYSGRYRVIELSVTDIDGEFKLDYPITTEVGAEEWIIPTISEAVIDSAGTNNQIGDRVDLVDPEDYLIERTADLEGEFDCRVTSFLNEGDITVETNGISLTDFTFDGRTIKSSSISIGDTVTVTAPSVSGYFSVSQVDQDGGVIELEITEAPIGTHKDYSLTTMGYGSGFSGTANTGQASKVNGYYRGNKGQLSSNMYLQDSFYYQEYSYAIKTQQDISKYGSIVKDLLHPAGFKYFGNLSIIGLIEILISLEESSLEAALSSPIDSRAKYTLGPNYSFFDRFKSGLSPRLYRMWHFVDKDEKLDDKRYVLDDYIEYTSDYVEINVSNYSYLRFDMGMVVSEQKYYMVDDYVQDRDDFVENYKYDLEDSSLERTYSTDYHAPNYFEEEYFVSNGVYTVPVKGWMTKHYFSDYHLYIPQEYSAEVESGYNYFETGYTAPRP